MFEATAASVPGGDAPNEDFHLVSGSWALVLDGITRYPDDGCVHDVPWYVRRLGAAIASGIGGSDALPEVLASAIGAVNALHASCDLRNPVSPGATVGMVRLAGGRIEWLVLGDCAVAWRGPGGIEVRSDGRLARLASPPAVVVVGAYRRYPVDYLARVRNRDGGFWVASTDPDAAAMAYTGAVPVEEVGELLLCTDGLTRLVDRYGHSWSEVFDRAEAVGVAGLIGLVREAGERVTGIGPNTKRHDDCTGIRLRF
ncbi:protein phosphatase 2C domain-containing protein [Glycomyces sp. NRRL B-16210]|uniref:protein phosphatase 2C domain-containing protein n=1 Tax=Glycomyces sp. NRRL B-16210 TaxID=1463821 RepID=UPI00055071EF|nr:protein phosphatase 2C domain-containing protein [Glycomyces sp. NRRL B-16210]